MENTKEESWNRKEVMKGFPSLPSGFLPTTAEMLDWSLDHLEIFVTNKERFGHYIREIKGLIASSLSEEKARIREELNKIVKEKGFYIKRNGAIDLDIDELIKVEDIKEILR